MKSKPAGEIETQRHAQDAGHGDEKRLDVAGQESRAGRKHALDQADGQKNASGHDRRIAQPLLHVKRQQIGTAQHADTEDRQHSHRNAEITFAEQFQIQQRIFAPQLPDDKDNECRSRNRKTSDHLRRTPPLGIRRRIASGQCEDQKGHETDHAQKTRPVETARTGTAPLLLDKNCKQNGRQSHRNIDIEDQVPTVIVHQITADQRTERDRSGGRHRPQPQGQPPLLRRKLPGNDRQAERLDDAAAEALQGTGRNQEHIAPGAAAEPRSEGEEHQPQNIHPFVADAVGDPTRRRQHERHGNHIGRNDPFGGRNGDVKYRHNGRQADVHDRHVHHGHESPEHHEAQNPPFIPPTVAYAFSRIPHCMFIQETNGTKKVP